MSAAFKYGSDKFAIAIMALAASADPIRIRLDRGYYHLTEVTEHHIPEDLRERYCEMIKQYRSFKNPTKEDTSAELAYYNADAEAVRLVSEIVLFNNSLWFWRESSNRKQTSYERITAEMEQYRVDSVQSIVSDTTSAVQPETLAVSDENPSVSIVTSPVSVGNSSQTKIKRLHRKK